MALTARQEKFSRLVALGHTQSDAYREAYSTDNMTDKTIHEESSKLASSPKVSTRIGELKAKQEEHVQKKHNIELDDLVGMIMDAANIAKTKDDANNLRGAAMDIAKLTGQIVDKQQITGNLNLNKNNGSIVERFVNRNKDK